MKKQLLQRVKSSLSLSELEGDYAGVLFVEGDEEGNDSTKPVSATISSDQIEVVEWDVESNTAKSGGDSGIIHTLINNVPMNGFIKGELDVDGDTNENTYAFTLFVSRI